MIAALITLGILFIAIPLYVWYVVHQSWKGPKKRNVPIMQSGLVVYPVSHLPKGKVITMDRKVFMNDQDYLLLKREIRLQETFVGRTYARLRKWVKQF